MPKLGFAAAVMIGALLLPGALLAQKNSCLECHSKLEDELKAPVEGFKLDIHQQFGLSCADCHGGNPAKDDENLAKDKTFRGAPKRPQVPAFCARCHSDSAYIKTFNPRLRVDQLDQYRTSRHGLLLQKGDTKVAVCTDCHGVHGIQTAKHPKSRTFPWNVPQTCGRCHADAALMKAYGIPTSQLEEYKQSVHARALFEKKDMSAPVCNSCHGNHGAAPPDVKSIAFVCRQCHPSAGELFSKSPHKKAFDEMGFSECEACHGKHKILQPADAMLGTEKGALCAQCHEPGSKPSVAAGRMRQLLGELTSEIDADGALLDRAERKGVEVSDPKYRLQEIHTLLVSVRNLTHGLDLADIEEKAGEGKTLLVGVRASAEAALREARLRRTGLVVATIFLILFALAFYLKIRQMRGRPKA
ncbi:MAG: cytochrome c3 family protein [Candidatus Aminicenantales bacterium]|jgi:predicted CXXCH cytochrome family protein